jgi:uncharacterized protein with GYD domain
MILYKFTDQGSKTVKESPARVDAAIKAVESCPMTMLLWLSLSALVQQAMCIPRH